MGAALTYNLERKLEGSCKHTERAHFPDMGIPWLKRAKYLGTHSMQSKSHMSKALGSIHTAE